MAHRDLVDSYVRTLGDFRLDAEGLCRFTYDDEVEFTLEAPDTGDVVLIHGALVQVGGEPEPLFRRALEANLYLLDTAGASIGYHADFDELVLTYWLTGEDLDSADAFTAALTNFAEIMRRARTGLRETRPAIPPAPVATDTIMLIRA
jgi:hypothetical protein